MLRPLTIVEDMRAMRTMFTACARAAGISDIAEACGSRDGEVLCIERGGVALIDVKLGGMDCGVELASRLRGVRPELHVLLVSGYWSPVILADAMRSGALGLVSKNADDISAVMAAIREVADGKRWISPSLVSMMWDAIADTAPGSLSPLDEREEKILYRIVKFADRADIAAELDISDSSLRRIVREMKVKVGLGADADTADLVGRCRELGLTNLAARHFRKSKPGNV